MSGKKHQCEQIQLNGGIVTTPPTIEHVRESYDGASDTYRCKVCGETFTIRWPD